MEYFSIKTFEDVCKDQKVCESELYYPDKHLIALHKINLIRKALNKNWNPILTEGVIYYAYVKIYPPHIAKKITRKNNKLVLKEIFLSGYRKYQLVGGYSFSYNNKDGGLIHFDDKNGGGTSSYLGLFGCRNEEIAKHMSKYFAKEIFEACYSQYSLLYKWI